MLAFTYATTMGAEHTPSLKSPSPFWILTALLGTNCTNQLVLEHLSRGSSGAVPVTSSSRLEFDIHNRCTHGTAEWQSMQNRIVRPHDYEPCFSEPCCFRSTRYATQPKGQAVQADWDSASCLCICTLRCMGRAWSASLNAEFRQKRISGETLGL